jgi:transcriptional regulator with XRE-family HTH domain
MKRPRNFPTILSTPRAALEPPDEELLDATPPGASILVMSTEAVLGSVMCGDPDDCHPATDTIAAPQPALAQACWWSRARRRVGSSVFASTHEPTVRESDIHRSHSSPDLLMRHGTEYATDRCSLSVGFVVHETSRDLDTGRSFGRHVRSLRRARGMTQEVLAERCGLSADTIRRLEHGSFSPSLDTLRKLCGGLDLMLSTLFESYELGARNEARELIDLLATRGPRELVLATRVLRALFAELDGINSLTSPEPTSSPPLDDDDDDDLDD